MNLNRGGKKAGNRAGKRFYMGAGFDEQEDYEDYDMFGHVNNYPGAAAPVTYSPRGWTPRYKPGPEKYLRS